MTKKELEYFGDQQPARVYEVDEDKVEALLLTGNWKRVGEKNKVQKKVSEHILSGSSKN